MVINRGKRGKTSNEVKPVGNINKNPQSSLKISTVDCEFMRYQSEIL